MPRERLTEIIRESHGAAVDREQLYLLGFILAGLALIALVLVVLGNLLGFAILAAIGCGLGLLADSLYPSGYAHGRLRSTVIGLGGALLGHQLFGSWGPSLQGIHLLPSLIGALLLSYLLRKKKELDRAQIIEELSADEGGETDPYLKMRFGDYRVVKFLGAGAFARVYKALPDKELEGPPVAVKVFSKDALASDNFQERFKREVALSQNLQHPNIVKIMSAAQEGDIHYLLMEYVDGPNLTQVLKERGRLEMREVLEWSLAMARALGHAHSKGVVHRDIKPDNVLLGPDGPKVTDFGLARLEGTSSLTQSGSAIGTPHYMSPEQVVEEKSIDGRADQYSLACMMYELLTGEKLFDGDQAVHVVMKQVQEAPRDPRLLRMEIPERLSQTILKMLSKKREERFPSMEPIVERLAWLLTHWEELPQTPRGPALAAP